MMKPPIELTLSSQKDLTPDNLITSSTRILAQPGIGLKRRDVYIQSFSKFSEMLPTCVNNTAVTGSYLDIFERDSLIQ